MSSKFNIGKNMDFHLNANAILVGHIDLFCLVCQRHLIDNDEGLEHTADPMHTKNFQSADIVKKYKDDKIMKVKQGYFCMHCNAVFATGTKVSLHIAEVGHKGRRGTQFLRREGAAIVFQDVLVGESAWHGIVGDMCAVCNLDIEDETAHKKESTHVFNLVNNSVEFGSKKEMYRKIDDTTFQCITCNKVFLSQDLSTHFEDSDHIDIILNCANAYLDLKNSLEYRGKLNSATDDCKNKNSSSSEGFNSADETGEESFEDETKYNSKQNIAEILNSVITFEKNEVNINFISETAVCKKCLENVDFDYKTLKNHIDEHNKNPKKIDVGYVPFQCEVNMKVVVKNSTILENKNNLISTVNAIKDIAEVTEINNDSIDSNRDTASITDNLSTGLDRNHNAINNESKSQENNVPDDIKRGSTKDEDPLDYAKSNHLTYNKGNNNAYCRLCETKLPSTLRSMKEHVAGNSHKKRLNASKKQEPKPNMPSKPTSSKMTMEDYIEEVFTINGHGEEKVVNEKFCMKLASYHLLSTLGNDQRCQACEMNIMNYELTRHIESYMHKRNLFNTLVIMKYDSEFVREIRPNLFHCAFCNLIEVTELRLTLHLSSLEHTKNKKYFERRLVLCMPSIRQHKQDFVRRHIMRAMFGWSPFF